MAQKTLNLGLNIWNENDYVDFEEINENFIKLDNMPVCVESGIKTATYTGGILGSAEWYYKRYTDGTVEMSASLQYNSLRCEIPDDMGISWYSNPSEVSFPFQFEKVYDVQTHLNSSSRGWVIDTTGEAISDHIALTFMNAYEFEESDWRQEYYKQVFITVKGVIADG